MTLQTEILWIEILEKLYCDSWWIVSIVLLKFRLTALGLSDSKSECYYLKVEFKQSNLPSFDVIK